MAVFKTYTRISNKFKWLWIRDCINLLKMVDLKAAVPTSVLDMSTPAVLLEREAGVCLIVGYHRDCYRLQFADGTGGKILLSVAGRSLDDLVGYMVSEFDRFMRKGNKEYLFRINESLTTDIVTASNNLRHNFLDRLLCREKELDLDHPLGMWSHLRVYQSVDFSGTITMRYTLKVEGQLNSGVGMLRSWIYAKRDINAHHPNPATGYSGTLSSPNGYWRLLQGEVADAISKDVMTHIKLTS